MAKSSKLPKSKANRSVLEMTAKQARAFFLKEESYCNIEFPVYITFKRLLAAVAKEMQGKPLSGMTSRPRDHEGVNYSMLSNKDGRHAWRPLQLIHPAIYVSLVEQITSAVNWRIIQSRFDQFRKLANFTCISIPVEATSKQKDKAAQILSWWQGIEQHSIELALDYNHVFHADITDCYSSIYTHSIAWAIHDKAVAKAKGFRTDLTQIGNQIDAHIQDMRHGQTNGIPQGSVLMDFISELVLGYADLELSQRLTQANISGFQILRYRDDYRIFVHSPHIGEQILKGLTEVLIGLGLKLNSGKTTGSLHVVSHSLKLDKKAWFRGRQGDRNLQKHLLVIHAHGTDFPNAGSLTLALTKFHSRLIGAKHVQNPLALISIVVDIAYSSPRVFPVCAAIVSVLLGFLSNKHTRIGVIKKIYHKLSQLPNTGHMEAWLQRISHSLEPQLAYTECLCQVVKGVPTKIWNNDWITSNKLKGAIDPTLIVNKSRLKALKPVIKPKEIAIFKILGEFSS